MKKPLVTVLMPVYNAEKYIVEAINSILNQTFTEFEYLIIDDGSTDKSLEIIKSYNDKRIRLVENGVNIKLIATLNKGLDLIESKYICRMDADDISVPTRIGKQLKFMEENPEYKACSSWVHIFFEKTNRKFDYKLVENHNDIRFKTLYQNHFCHPASFIRTDFINKNNLHFDKKYIHSEDYSFFVRLSEIGKIYNIQEVLLRIRKHDSNVSVLNSNIQDKNSIMVIDYQLNKIGIDTKNFDYELYFRFFYTFDFNKKDLEAVEQMVLQIINANLKSKYLPHKEFIKFLCDKWYHICVNSTKHGMWVYEKFTNSELSKYLEIDFYKKIKFIIKSGIKYNKS